MDVDLSKCRIGQKVKTCNGHIGVFSGENTFYGLPKLYQYIVAFPVLIIDGERVARACDRTYKRCGSYLHDRTSGYDIVEILPFEGE